MKVLMLYGGPQYYYGNFINEFNKIVPTDGCNILYPDSMKTDYDAPNIEFNQVIMSKLTSKEVKSYDVVMGLDNGCIDALFQFKPFGCKVGCQILDYPKHTFKHNKDYVESTVVWEEWKLALKDFDFLIHCRENVQHDLKKYIKGVPSVFHILPCNIINIEDYERKNYILYSGAINPAKGVHYLVDSLSIIENPPELVVVGQGYNLSDYAKFLRVPYKQLNNVSEYDKFKMYHECRFLVYGHDTGVIPCLSLLEGIGVGRMGICFNFPEHKIMYKQHVTYCQPYNIASLANSIEFFMNKKVEDVDKIAEGGPQYVREQCSFSSWAKKIYDFLEVLCKR